MSPRASFLCHPERSEGSLGAYAPWDDIPGHRPERSEVSLPAFQRFDLKSLLPVEITKETLKQRKQIAKK